MPEMSGKLKSKILVYAPATVDEFRSPYPNYFRM